MQDHAHIQPEQDNKDKMLEEPELNPEREEIKLPPYWRQFHKYTKLFLEEQN